MPLSLALAALAGFGYQIIYDGRMKRVDWGIPIVVLACEIMLIVVVWVLFNVELANNYILSPLINQVTQYNPTQEQITEIAISLESAMLIDTTIAIVFTALTIVLIYLYKSDLQINKYVKTVMVIFIISNLMFYAAPLVNTHEVDDIYKSEIPETDGRVYDSSTTSQVEFPQSSLLNYNENIITGQQAVSGYNPQILAHSKNSIRELHSNPRKYETYLDMLNVSYIITYQGSVNNVGDYHRSSDFKLVGSSPVEVGRETKTAYIFKNKQTLPQAYFIPGIEEVQIDVSDNMDNATGLPIKRETNEISVSGSFKDSGYVIISQSWYPLWNAQVNGERVNTRKTEEGLTAIPVSEGEKTIKLSYESWPLRLGAGMSLLGISLVILLFYLRTHPSLKRIEQGLALQKR